MDTTTRSQAHEEAEPVIPDYLSSPNAVLGDTQAQWRYGRPPDYSKTRKVWAESRQMNHAAGSLQDLVENLVKNWEIEASFKTQLSEWRTVDQDRYTFAVNGGPPQSGEHMLKVGTYNAIIAPSEYYSPENSDFASSHKTFKRMMPTFAWEVIEVYSGPPCVAFKWRHWGVMKNDYVGFNDKGEKVTAKAHGGLIDITGITIANVDQKVRLREVDTYFDPLDMFRQIAPRGVVNKKPIDRSVFDVEKAAALDDQAPTQDSAAEHHDHNSASGFDPPTTGCPGQISGMQGSGISYNSENAIGRCPVSHLWAAGDQQSKSSKASNSESLDENRKAAQSKGIQHPKQDDAGDTMLEDLKPENGAERSLYSSGVTGSLEDGRIDGQEAQFSTLSQADAIDEHLEKSSDDVHPHPKSMERMVQPRAGEAVAVASDSVETKETHDEMSHITRAEYPLLMNRE